MKRECLEHVNPIHQAEREKRKSGKVSNLPSEMKISLQHRSRRSLSFSSSVSQLGLPFADHVGTGRRRTIIVGQTTEGRSEHGSYDAKRKEWLCDTSLSQSIIQSRCRWVFFFSDVHDFHARLTIKLVSSGPPELNFGEVCIYAPITKYLSVLNNLEQFISVNIDVGSSAKQILSSCSTRRV